MNSLEFDAIGTHWQISYAGASVQKETLRRVISELIEDYDALYSRFRPDSQVTTMSKRAGTYRLPAHSKDLLSLYKKLYDLSDGLFTPLIGQVISDAGYDADYSLIPKSLHSPVSWEEAIEYQSPIFTVRVPSLLDFGAAGKGQLIDLVGALLFENGCANFVVDAGGDILQVGNTPLRIGLENPNDLNQVIGIVSLKNKSLAGSAGNRRNWGEYHHLINPKTLESPTDILATWVIADTTMLADGLSTYLFFASAQTLQKNFSFEYLILGSDFSIEKSDHFPAELFFKP